MTESAFAVKFGKWLREEREALSLSQAQVGEAVEVSDSTISNWEKGLTSIGALSERRLRAYFRTKHQQLGIAELPV